MNIFKCDLSAIAGGRVYVSGRSVIVVDYSDEELAARAGEDKGALSELVSRYSFVASAKARAISNDYYEDLYQEGLIGVVAAARSYNADKGASFATYANRCIKNRMINAIKKLDKGITEALDDDFENECADKSEIIPDNIIERRERLGEINAKMASVLSDKEWRVFMLFSMGLGYDEIGRDLGMSEKQVNNAMQRARRKLRAELGNI